MTRARNSTSVPTEPVGPTTAGPVDPPGVTLLGSFDVTNYAAERLRPGSPHLAVGRDHVVAIDHMSITWAEKDGSAKTYIKLLDFFAGLERAPGTAIDPRVQYDPLADRFVVSAMDQIYGPKKGPSDDVGRVLLAVSDDGDPNGDWHLQAIDLTRTVRGEQTRLDYPILGIGKDALYLTGNLFSFSPGTYSSLDHAFVVAKGLGSGGLYDGGTSSVKAIRPGAATGTECAFLYPATLSGPADGADMYLLSYGQGLRPDKDTGDLPVRIISVTDPLAKSGPVLEAAYVVPDLAAGRVPGANKVPQPEGAPEISGGIFGTVPHDVAWRGDELWLATVLEPEAGPDKGQSTVHWLEIGIEGRNDYRLLDHGSVGGDELAAGTETYLPSIDVDAAGNVGIGFVASGPSLRIGSFVTGRAADDPAGTTRAPEPLRLGELLVGVGDAGRWRWGDHSGTAVDPVDGSFWTHNAHAGSTFWQSTVGHFILE